MNTGVVTGLLQLINAAVTPVVLISACAALILGINNKHTAIADRLRTFATDLRGSTDSADRKAQIREQVDIFFKRYRLTWVSLATLYGSVISFVLMILFIILSQKHILRWESGVMAMFLIGIGLTLCSVICEVFELRLSIRSLEVELRDL
jgi:hypothetical protein